MKKILTGGLLAVAAASMLFAATDKINLYDAEGYLNRSIAVEDIENMSYTSSTRSEGFSHMNLNFRNGASELLELSANELMEYQASRGDCPVKVEVKPRYTSAQLTITGAEPSVFYRISGMPEWQLESFGMDESIWAESLMYNDIEYIKSVAASMERPLSSFNPEEVFEYGNQVRDWFPGVIISDDTKIALVVYTAKIENNEVVPTSDPTMIRFCTNVLDIQPVDFSITVEPTSTKVNIKADAPEEFGDRPFCVAMFSESDVAASGLNSLAYSKAAQLEQLVYKYGKTWEEVTPSRHAEVSYKNLCVGEKYYAVAFGCEYGVVDTEVKAVEFTVPEPVVTDNCTFEVVASQISPAEFSIAVTPSSPDTHYAALLVQTDKFSETYTPSYAVGRIVQYLNQTNTIIDWFESELVFTGEQVLSTKDNMLEGLYLKVDTEYTALIFGVEDDGTRTTELKRVDFTPTTAVQTQETLSVSFGAFEGTNKWTHYLEATVAASNPDAKFVFNYLSEDNYMVNLDKTDEEFITDYIAAEGQWLELFTGEKTRRMSFASSYDSSAGGYVFKPYIMFAFGYDGEATTALYMYRINTETGDVEQLRGPAEAESLTFDIVQGAFDGTSKWTHYLETTVTPSDSEAKYVFNYLPESNSLMDLTKTDEEFIADYVAAEGSWLELFTGEKTRKMSFSSSYDSSAGGYVFKPYILFVFGYDGETTSELYMYRIDAGTGAMEQLRGPGM